MSPVVPRDRLERLLAAPPPNRNGIDYVEIANTQQTRLDVHFLNTVAVAGTLGATNPIRITGGARIETVDVAAFGFSADDRGRPVLRLRVDAPGDFSTYTLTIDSSALDPYFDHVTFSFKARCDSTVDCEPPPHICPPPAGAVPPIDYLAKDFLSFRKALTDFSALRYPEWSERSEADFGMMFLEALSKIGDDLSYLQDRIAFESSLETATQRRSIVRHARMVDYEPRPAIASRVLLQFDVPPGVTFLTRGIGVTATAPDGEVIPFETGTGLRDTTKYGVDARWNRSAVLRAYYWDDADRCLLAGSTELWIAGHGHGLTKGTALLIDTRAIVSADAPIREVVHLLDDAAEELDPIFNEKVTHIVWSADEALRFDHDISIDTSGDSRTIIVGNLVPATQGRRASELFAIESAPSSAPNAPLAIVREETHYLWTLRDAPLAFLPAAIEGDAPLPEIELTEQSAPPLAWTWKRRLLDARASERAFTTEPFRMSQLNDANGPPPYHDYDGDDGQTLRFGAGSFGAVPDPGTLFRVTYRAGGGSGGNVAADSITVVDPATPQGGLTVTNPFAASGGADLESNDRVRALAPQAFRAKQFRAVRPEDYSAAAETLAWVSRGGTVPRWTGSWTTIFTTADPKGTTSATIDQKIELIELLNRYRMAGREVYTPPPVYVALDLFVFVCATRDALRGDVEESVRAALAPHTIAGFFHPDRFTFGQSLHRSALEAAVQKAHGVDGIVQITILRRGRDPVPHEMPAVVRVASNEILRLDADRSRPEFGSLAIRVRGGR